MRPYRASYIKFYIPLLVFISIQAGILNAQTYPPRPIVYGLDPDIPRLYGFDTSQNWSRVISRPLTVSNFAITSLGGLAFDPCTYEVYATAIFSGLTTSNLIKINITTGVCFNVGSLGDIFVSIQFDKNGNLYGVTGEGPDVVQPETFYSIDKTNASKTQLKVLGNGDEGEVIVYNRHDDMMFHLSGNSPVVYEKFKYTSPYTLSPISTGPPNIEITGGLCIGPNKFLLSNYFGEYLYADTLGNFTAPVGGGAYFVRGLIMPPSFATSSISLCRNVAFTVTDAAATGYTITYDWNDGTPPAVVQPGTVVSHTYTTTGTKTISVTLSDGVCLQQLYTNLLVSVIDAVPANAGPDQATCGITPVSLSANNATGSWTGGAGTFNPNRNTFNAVYTPALSELGKTITLTWNTPGSCGNGSDQMQITISTPVTANAGPDRVVCNTTAASLNATASSGGNWTGGIGNFNPTRNFANATYTPDASEVGTTVTLTWNVPDPDGAGPCNGASDNMTVKVNSSYTANAGPDQTSCNDAPITLAANPAPTGSWIGGIGSFDPNRRTANAVFSPFYTEIGTTVVLTWVVDDPDGSEPCVGSSDQMSITIVASPNANAGADQQFCGLQTATLAANAATGGNWTGGLGAFSPNRNKADATYTPAASELGTIVNLTWNIPDPDNNGACTASSDVMTITYSNNATANAGTDQVICGAVPVSLSANVIAGANWVGGAGLFSPDRNTANATYTPAFGESGSTVVLTWFVPDPDGSGPCISSSDQVNITINIPAFANAGSDQIICGSSPITLAANNVSGGNWIGGAGIFNPNRNTANATYTPAGSEIGNTITLTWNVPDPDGTGPCTSASDAMTIKINNPASANAGPDKSTCGRTAVILAATATANGNWTGGNGAFSPNRSVANATYTPAANEIGTTVTLTWNIPDPDGSGPCTSSSDVMFIYVSSAVTANAGADISVCNNTTVTLGANGATGGNWIGGAGIFSPGRNAANATYTPTVAEIGTTIILTWNIPDPDGAGPCSESSDNVSIIVSSPVIANAGSDQFICGIVPVLLAANTTNGGNWTGGNGTFSPNRSAANANYTPSLSELGTTITLTWNVPDPDGTGPCTSVSDAMTITVSNGVTANAGPDQTVCGPTAIQLFANIATGGNWVGGNGTFNPNRNTANAIYTPSSSENGTLVTLTWNIPDIDGSGPCIASSDAMSINVNNLTIANAGPDQVTCTNTSVTLAANTVSGGNWTGGAGIFSPDRNTANATYTPALSEIGTTITLTWNIPDQDGTGPCTSTSDAMTLKSNPATIANAGPDFVVCGKTPVTLGANAVNGAFWTGGVGIFTPNRNAPDAIYTPATSEIGGVIVLRWNLPDPDGTGPCPIASEVMVIEVHTGATADAGPDQIICGASTITLAANAVSGGSWTGGSGSFNPNRNTANAIYTPSAGEFVSGVTLTWNVPDPDGADPCTSTSDDMIITATAITADAGPNQTVCSNVTAQLSAVGSGSWTGGLGTFTPNRNSANATYTPAASEIGITIMLTWNTPGSGSCPSTSDAMTLTTNTAVLANAGADKFVCGANAVLLDATAATGGNWIGGNGAFTPDRNAANATYTPTAGEIGTPVTLTWNVPDPDGAGPCTSASDAMTIIISTPVTANAGNDQTICSNTTVTLTANTATGGNWTGGSGIFSPSRNAANVTYTPSASEIGTTVTLTWNVPDPDGTGPCNAAADAVTITVNSPVFANAGADKTICGIQPVNLSANIIVNGIWLGGTGVFTPSRNAANAIYTPAAGEIGTTVPLTWSVPDPDGAGPCVAATDGMTITINAPVTANAGADKSTCGVTAVALGAIAASGGNWTGGNGTFTPNRTTANATYTPTAGEVGITITLTWNIPDPDNSGPCTSSSDAMTVTVNTSVTANAGADQTVCGINSITLAANSVTGGNWTGGLGIFTPSRNAANATYTPTVGEIGTTVILTWNVPDPDGSGPCTSSLDAMNIIITNQPQANAGADQIICGATVVNLGAVLATGGNWIGGTGTFNPNRNTANAAYTPSAGEIGNTINLTWNIPDPDGAGPCSGSSDVMTITFNNSTIANAGPDKSTCGATAVALGSIAATGGNWTGGNGIFTPNRTTANATYTPAASEIGTTVTLTWNLPDPDGAGPCTISTDAMIITVSSLVIANAGPDQITCNRSPVTLAANTASGGNWIGGTGTFTPGRNTANTIYTPAVSELGTTFTLTWNIPDPDGTGPCSSSADAMNLTVTNSVLANAGPDQTVCGNSTATLAATNATGGSWSGGNGTFNPNRNTFNAIYTPTTGEIGTTVNLTWTVPDPDGTGPCNATSDIVAITFTNQIVVSAGPDQTICGNSMAGLSATAINGGNWTGGAGSFLPNRNTANANYIPAASEYGSTITLTWNIPDPDGSGPCIGGSDNVQITISRPANAFAGVNQTICGNGTATLAATAVSGGNWTGGAGTFNPNRNTANAVYTPAASEIGTTVTLTWNVPDPDGVGPCGAASDFMSLRINTPVTSNAGPDQVVCGSASVQLFSNYDPGGNWIGGTGTFTPDRNSNVAVYTASPSEYGTVVTLTWNVFDPDGTQPCTAANDQMTITVNAPATANAGTDKLTCGTSPVTLGATAISGGNWTGGTGVFNPGRTTANAVYTPAPGEVGTTISLSWNVPDPDGSGPCSSVSDAMLIFINATPNANAGADKQICGIANVTLAANAITGAIWTGGTGTFNPDRNAANAVYTPAASELGTTVTLTWNAPDPDGPGPCSSASDAMMITINTPAVANAGTDQTICATSSATLAANTATGGNWTGGAGTFSPNRNTANAIYTPAAGEAGTTITLTWNVPDPDGAGPCIAASDAMNIVVSNFVVANAGIDQTACGIVAVSLNANVTTGGNWIGGTGTFNPNRNTANAIYTPAAGEVGTTVTLTWNVPDPDGTGPCTSNSDAMIITISTPVTANAGTDKIVCGATAVTLNANIISGGNWTGGNGIFTPDRNAANATYTPAASEIGTTVTLTWNVPDPDGTGPCSAANDAMAITVNSPVTANAGADQIICGASGVSLNANIISGGNWTGGNGTFNPNRTTANATYTPTAGEIGTTITLTWNVPDPDGTGPCNAALDAMTITVNLPVTANAGVDQTICGASAVSLNANIISGGNWTGGTGTFNPNRNTANATYTPAASEIGTTVTLSWNVPDPDGSGPCNAATDAMTITINSPVTVSAGTDQTICGTTAVSLSANNVSGGNWTGGAGTFNPNRNAANATYTPAASEIGTTITLTWNAPDPDGTGPCNAVSDAMTITVSSPVTANAGIDQTVCGATTVSLNANIVSGGNWTGGNGTFNPNRNTANATYTPTAGEIGTTITLTWNAPDPDGTGPCNAASDAMVIIINSPVIANAGVDKIVCGATAVSLNANIISGGNWTGGNGTFTPDRNTANATYTPAASEIGTTVTLTWNAPDPDGTGPCNAATDAMTIIVNAPVTANAGADQTVCGASIVSLNANIVSGGNWTDGAGTFNPGRNAANATYTPAASEIGTTITLTWNAPDPDGTGPCNAASDAMTIAINSPVTTNAGIDQTVCGASVVSLNANIISGGNWTGGTGTFTPDRNTANATYTPAASEIGTTVTLTWNAPDPDGAGPCNGVSDVMTITVNSLVTANAGTDQTVCGATAVSLNANVTTGGNWTGGNGTFNPNRNTANAIYTPATSEIGTTVTLTWSVPDPDGAGPCNAASDAMTITVNPPVTANAGADQTVCGASAVSLNANIISGGNWTGGTGTFTPDRNTANATYTPAASEIGTTVTLTWNAPDPDGAGPCNGVTDAMTITVNSLATANAGSDQTVCGATAVSLNANVITGGNWAGGAGTFNPNRNTANATYTPAASEIGTTVTLTWSVPDPDGAGPCDAASDAMTITVNSPVIANAGIDQTVCVATIVSLNANVVTGGNWSGGTGTFNPNRNTANATYTPTASEIGTTLILTWNVPDQDGTGPCTAASDAMTITINSPVTANAGADQNVCGASPATLNANVVIGGNWSGGTGTFTPDRNTANATYTPSASEIGTTLTLTWNVPDPDATGPCSATSDAMNIIFNSASVANAGPDQTSCGITPVQLAALGSLGGNWSGGNGTFVPDRNTANATYTPSAGEVGITIILTWNVPDPDGSGPCAGASDDMSITFNTPINVNAGADQTVCGANAVSLNANIISGGNWTGGIGTFTPDRNTADATYTPAASEIGTTITLTWNAPDPDGTGPCSAGSDLMTITVNSPVTASAGTDQTVCGATAVSLNANIISGGNWTGGNGAFTPDRNAANATYTPAASDIGTTVILTWNAPDPDGTGPCTAASDAMTITINSPVIANAGVDQTVCGATTVSLNANIISGGNWIGGAGSFTPGRNAANATYTPAVSEIGSTVTLTWNAPDPDGTGPCNAASDAMTLTVNSPVTANAGVDQTVCGAATVSLNANIISGGNWTGGTGTFTPDRNAANATYTLAASDIGTTVILTWNAPDPDGTGPCSAVSDAMTITVNSPVTANAGADQTVCGAAIVSLNANIISGGNWIGGAGSFTPDRNAANAIYTTAASEIGSTVTLTWNAPDPDGAGPCNAASDAMTIAVNSPVTANAGTDQIVCGATTVSLNANIVTGGNWTNGAGSFTPDRNTANATYTPAASEIGTTVTLTWNAPDPDGTGPCNAASDVMTITVNSPVTASAGTDQTVCGATAVSLNANIISGGNWTGGTGTFTPDRNAANATYTPAASEIGTSVSLTWNAPDPDGTGPCNAASDVMTITVNSPVISNAGADQIVCGATAISLNANIISAGNWTGGNGSFIPDRNTANATYTPAASEIGTTVTLTWNAPDPDANGPCTAASDEMMITVNSPVTSNAAADQTVCGTSAVSLNANIISGGNWTGGAGTFTPDRNAANATYTPATSEIGTTVTLTWNAPDPDANGPCNAASDAMTITVNSPVTANAGADQTVCGATAVSLNANIISGGNWTGGTGSFTPDRNTANATYTPAASEIGTTVTLTWNAPDPDANGPCTAASDAMTITVNSPATANAGADQHICGTATVILNANIVSGGSWIGGTGTFTPDRNTANATYTPAASEIGTTITLTWNVPDPDGTGPCSATSDAMNIIFNSATVANAGPDQTSCGITSVQLAALGSFGGNWTGGTGTFAPDRNTANATYTPAAGEVGTTITLTWNIPDPDGSGPCTAASDVMTITINAPVTANAGIDQTSCSNSPVTLAANALNGGNWTGGAGTFSPDRNAATAIYTPAIGEIGTTVTLVWNIPDPDGNGPCPAVSDAMILTVNAPVMANAGTDQTVCGVTAALLNANVVTGGNWTGGTGTFNPNRNTANATYTPAASEIGTTITLTWNIPDPDGNGPCTSADDAVNITFNSPAVSNAGPDQISCGISPITLAANTSTGGNWAGGAGTFTPDRNSANATYTPAAAEVGTTVLLTWNIPDPDGNGPCTAASDQISIVVNAPAVIDAGADQMICGINTVSLSATVITGGNWTGGAGTFTPDRNAANATYTPGISELGTAVTLVWNVPDPDGIGPCTATSDDVIITINTPTTANAGSDQVVCGLSPVNLSANTASGGNWTGGAGTFNPNRNTANAIYIPVQGEMGTTVTLIWNVPDPDGNGPCQQQTDQLSLTINNTVIANAGPDQTSCGASPITLAGNTTTGGNWTGGTGTFAPNRNDANAIYTPAAAEIGTAITLTWNVPDPDGSGPCTSSTDNIVITIGQSTVANAGPDQVICGNGPATLAANATTDANWIGGAGTFVPDRNTANATYTPAASEIGTTVILTWNVPDPDGNGPCTAASDQMNITFNNTVVSNAGPDQTSCGNASITLNANAIGGGNWTGGAGIFVPDRNTANATYTPAASELGATVTLTWNIPDPDGNGPCTAASDQMNITINNATLANAGSDQTSCGASPITLAANAATGANWVGGAGTFVPDRNTANATYTPAASEIGTTVTLTWNVPDPDGTGPCISASDQMNININNATIANAGADQTSCGGSPITLAANATTGGNWIGGAGTFVPDRNAANATYTPSSSEIGTTVILTWNVPDPDGNGPCTSASDQINITINNAIVANAGSDQTSCGSSVITLAANSANGGNWTGGVGTFVPSRNFANATYTPAASEIGTTVTLTWNVPDPDGNGPCTATSDEVNIVINNATIANAGIDQAGCGASPITLAANIATGGNWTGGAGTFNPNRNTANATYSPSASEIGTTVTLTWNVPDPDGNGSCTAASDEIDITINNVTIANAGNDQTSCSASPITLAANTATGGNWTGGAGTFIPDRNAANATYTPTASEIGTSVILTWNVPDPDGNGPCTSSSDQVILTINNASTANAGNDQTSCGISPITLAANNVTGGNWTGGAGTFNPDRNTANATYTPAASEIGTTITLTWNIPDPDGNGPCTAASDQINLTINNALTANAGSDQTSCGISPITLAANTATGGNWTGGAGTFAPDRNAANATYTPAASELGTTVTLIWNIPDPDGSGPCTAASDQLILTINNGTTANAGTDQTSCSSSPITLAANTATGGNWTGGAGTFNPNRNTANAIYTPAAAEIGTTVTLTWNIPDPDGSGPCTAASDQINLIINNTTTANAGIDQTSCGSSPIILAANVITGGNWTGGAGTFNPNRNTANATYTPAASEIGTTLTLTWNVPDPDGNGPCTAASDQMSIIINANCCVVTPGTISGDQIACANTDPNIISQSTAASGNGVLTYRWEKSTTSCSTGFSTITGATSSTYDPPAGIIQTTYYRRIAINTLSGSASCEAISNCVVITFNEGPTPNIINNMTYCIGSTVPSIALSTNTPGATIQWSRTVPVPDIGSIPTSGIGNLPSFTTINSTTSPIVSTFTVSANIGGCTGAPMQFSITVIPKPTITLQLPFDTLNNNAGPITLTGGSPAGGVYSGLGINSGHLTPSALPIGSYVITYQYSLGSNCNGFASDRYTIIPQATRINVFPNPSPNGALSISATPEMVGAYVRVFNTAGQKMKEWLLPGRLTSYQFEWAAGIYIFEFSKENLVERKLVFIVR